MFPPTVLIVDREKRTREFDRAWDAWLELWRQLADPLGIEFEEETIGEFFRQYHKLRRMGAEFDGEFEAAMQRLAEGHDPDGDDLGWGQDVAD